MESLAAGIRHGADLQFGGVVERIARIARSLGSSSGDMAGVHV
jgi:hypothetical protein